MVNSADFTIEGNETIAQLQKEIARIQNDENAVIEVLRTEIIREYDNGGILEGLFNVAVLLARGTIDFSAQTKLLNFFIPRLKAELQNTISKAKLLEPEIAPEIKKLQIELINRYKDYAFKGIV